MQKEFSNYILEQLEAQELEVMEQIQTLWSGYGSIVRYRVIGGKVGTVIIKHIKPPLKENHPRGWNTNISHQRKLKSYQVESAWYQNYGEMATAACRIPKCYGLIKNEEELCILLEDLDALGYPIRLTQVSEIELLNCIKWLANFHATYLHQIPTGLWGIGTYWHLETRPDELEVLEDVDLKTNAKAIDALLKNSKYQTLVHGDAKLANFCFSEKGEVAAVDFQYAGGGVGMKDLAYFVGSCFYEEECESKEEEILNIYFKELEKALKRNNSQVEFKDLEKDWRALYPVAWADFHRFLKGWSPGHWKINSYSERICREVLDNVIK